MSEVADPSHGEPLPQPSEGPVVFDLVEIDFQGMRALGYSSPHLDRLMAMIREREQLGVRKYGMPLRAFNGRNPIQDSLEELCDAIAYLRQTIHEDNQTEQRFSTELTSIYRSTIFLAISLMGIKNK